MTPLKASIEHWERLAACTTPKQVIKEGFSGGSCPLCKANKGGCTHCVVMKHTGSSECIRTPYSAARLMLSGYIANSIDFPQKEVEAELEFLRMLQKQVDLGEL